jgi:hypothetical protein
LILECEKVHSYIVKHIGEIYEKERKERERERSSGRVKMRMGYIFTILKYIINITYVSIYRETMSNE